MNITGLAYTPRFESPLNLRLFILFFDQKRNHENNLASLKQQANNHFASYSLQKSLSTNSFYLSIHLKFEYKYAFVTTIRNED